VVDQENIHSIGGFARAAKLKPKHRKAIATKAASIRWHSNEKPQASNNKVK
jgi:hypothetical protein